MINFKDLEEKGYLVIPNFLTNDEISQCLDSYNNTRDRSISNGIINKNYDVFQDTVPHQLTEKLSNLLSDVRKHTNITTDYVRPRPDYFDNSRVRFGWHQDHEPYYQYQDNYNLLNAWIPLIKPQLQVSGLKFIPCDKLKEKCPNIYEERFLGKGAKKVSPDKVTNTTIIHDDSKGDIFVLPFNIEDIEDIPKVGVGDLILIRCDTLHSSQDNTDHRVSFSVRCLNLSGIVHRDKFFKPCKPQQKYMLNNPRGYQYIIDLFEKTGSETLTVADIVNS